MIYTKLKLWLEENGIEYIETDYMEPYETRDPQNNIQKRFKFLAPKKTVDREYKKLTIASNNGKMNLDVVFYKDGESYYIDDVYFGKYDFEFWHEDECDLTWIELMDIIQSIMNGELKFRIVSRADTGAWISDRDFDLSDPEDRQDFNKYMESSDNKSVHPYIRKGPMKHEIYDWNSYDCFVRE